MNGVNSSGLTGKKFIPGIAWFFLVSFLLFLPGSDIPTVGGWADKIYFDKWVHIGLFTILTFLFIRPGVRSTWSTREKWHYCIKIAIAASLWGITSEVVQKYFVPGRSFDLFDWAADSFGALVALIFCKKRFLRQK